MDQIQFCINNMCRTCGAYVDTDNPLDESVDIFTTPGLQKNIEKTNLQVSKDDNLPKRICKLCYDQFEAMKESETETLQAINPLREQFVAKAQRAKLRIQDVQIKTLIRLQKIRSGAIRQFNLRNASERSVAIASTMIADEYTEAAARYDKGKLSYFYVKSQNFSENDKTSPNISESQAEESPLCLGMTSSAKTSKEKITPKTKKPKSIHFNSVPVQNEKKGSKLNSVSALMLAQKDRLKQKKELNQTTREKTQPAKTVKWRI